MKANEPDHYYSTSFQEINWNGIPAYAKYVKDISAEIKEKKEKERLEQYFQTMVKNLSGGTGVVHFDKNGGMTPEFMSEGFLSMISMSRADAWELYRRDALAGVHPDDRERIGSQLSEFIACGESHCTLTYRLQSGVAGYRWVRVNISIIPSDDGEYSLYASYHDITNEREGQEQLMQQYNDLIIQHYRMSGPDTLFVGHCNITKDKIIEIIDHTDTGLLDTYCSVEEYFCTGISSFIADENERRTFLSTYCNASLLAAYENGTTELIQNIFMKMPNMRTGCYAQFKENLVAAPDSGDIIGIITVTDITEQTISECIFQQLSVTGYEYIMDLNLIQDSYSIITGNNETDYIPTSGKFSEWVTFMVQNLVVPKDQEQYAHALNPEEIRRRLNETVKYTFAFSTIDKNRDIRTKNMMVLAVDMRLGRVCLARTDITDSVRNQQGLLNVVASTFELLAFINIDSRSGTMHTRRTIQENLPPYDIKEYNDSSIKTLTNQYIVDSSQVSITEQFQLDTIRNRLEKEPSGYGFVLSCQEKSELRYKQLNVLWGDRNQKTVCMVRADVTDIMVAERQSQEALEQALREAEEANQAKSNFLSSMSHGIRTPMNAIIGMTMLAIAHLDNSEKVGSCLDKIAFSSQHLLSLINDILDMSKIEQSKITLNLAAVNIRDLVELINSMMEPQAEAAGLIYEVQIKEIHHSDFYGDSLRINQILINILGNAIKFTPEKGCIKFIVEEIPPVKNLCNVRYRCTVSDTGIGMAKEFLPYIFEPFSRNQNSLHIEGTGLGLSITKGLIDLMDGVISVESQPGKGTTFYLELESGIAPEKQTVQPNELLPSSVLKNKEELRGYCFLAAEDNAINSEILCELLEMYGAKSVVKVDGAQAVQEFQTAAPGTYDAILMDIQMPEMNGYEAARTIRSMKREDAKEIPIIAMTANAFSEDIKAAMDAGMNAHVAKPIDLHVLLSTLDKVLFKRSSE